METVQLPSLWRLLSHFSSAICAQWNNITLEEQEWMIRNASMSGVVGHICARIKLVSPTWFLYSYIQQQCRWQALPSESVRTKLLLLFQFFLPCAIFMCPSCQHLWQTCYLTSQIPILDQVNLFPFFPNTANRTSLCHQYKLFKMSTQR